MLYFLKNTLLLKMLLSEPSGNYHLFASSNIKDHWWQITITNVIIMRKKLRILEELTKWDTDTQREQMPFEKRHQWACFTQYRHNLFVCKKQSICEITSMIKWIKWNGVCLKAKWKTALIQGIKELGLCCSYEVLALPMKQYVIWKPTWIRCKCILQILGQWFLKVFFSLSKSFF